MADIGLSIGAALGQGLLDSSYAVEDSVAHMYGIMGKLGSIGSVVGQAYYQNELAPLEAQLKVGDKKKQELAEILAEGMGVSTEEFLHLSNFQLTRHDFGDQSAEAIYYIALLKQQMEAQNELNEKQKVMNELKKAQDDLSLLKAQQDLLNLIRDNNLSASILDGLELGLDADLGAILQATAQAMQELLMVAEAELGIASPSQKFFEIGQQITAGLANALWAGEDAIQGAMGNMMSAPSLSVAEIPTFTTNTAAPQGSFSAGGGGETGTGQTINITVKIDGGNSDQRNSAQRGVNEALVAAGISADSRRRI